MLDQAAPSPLPGGLDLTISAFVVGLGCLATSSFRKRAVLLPRKIWGLVALWSCVLFLLPVSLLTLAQGSVADVTEALIFTLIPALTAFFSAQSANDELLPKLGPALAGVTGAALILPFSLPSTIAGFILVGATFVSAGLVAYAALRLHRLLAEVTLLQVLPAACAGICLGGAVFWSCTRPSLPSLSLQQSLAGLISHVALQVALLGLTVWLLRDLTPVSYSTRFLLAPLLTILEGYVLLRPPVTWTLAAGVLLLIGSGIVLLRREHQAGSTQA